MPESDKSFSKIEFVTKIPLVSGTYLLRDDKNFMSLVGNFDHSLGVVFFCLKKAFHCATDCPP